MSAKWDVKKIRFKGEEYILVGDLERGGAITTEDDLRKFRVGYAHLYKDGIVRRYGEVIGTRDDIEVIGDTTTDAPDLSDPRLRDNFCDAVVGMVDRMLNTLDVLALSCPPTNGDAPVGGGKDE